MTLAATDLKAIEDAIVKLLRDEVGPIIKSQTGTMLSQQYVDKANQVDLVTKYDKQIELAVKSKLSELYPTFHFVGEEEYVPGETKISIEPTFILDPIDGTTNFIHGFPFSCCSLGLSMDAKPLVGVVYNPHLEQMFHASKGNGAFLNDERINVTARPLTLQKSVLGLEGGAERSEGPPATNFDKKMNTYRNLLREDGGYVHGFRSMGSAAMNVCYTAIGLLDAYWEGGCYAWDVCAGWCILQESGGKMVGGNPGEWDIPIERRVYLAVRGGCQPQEQDAFIRALWAQVDAPLEYQY
ncbi:inositol monophosphate 1-phosphatase INM2 KNAG_0F03360 [Huiozyma naganishii CBS 8797]|uniref:Inositol-1-monophosphatase n=1 Tax=Huiozyma naganishii (strain ATCC MYA-139 / BCRC 22969 / CBS 8797 / KCTC 17520 / NBRC 10181 / NCYC 3082 / Yp74L-3) TaxID=1071383 RepID=J7RN90_HUIN7|nr:hypothetical protein KNAG_0F03360 [Kazachstania naganishii CBS 8797]CCK70998.1 hypothetical protein KNAG_0F03360 [Kazachstania naganishii CBS 8797]